MVKTSAAKEDLSGLEWMWDLRVGSWKIKREDFKLRTETFAERARALAERKVNAVIICGCHFRWDWIAEFPALQEMYREIVSACHREGIKVIDHHSAIYISRPRDEDRERYEQGKQQAEALGLAGCPQQAPLTEYKGRNIEDWTQKDARTGETIYNPIYLSWQMCPNNLEFRKGYRDYLSGFLTTGIDGLMCDDIQFVPTWHSCGCSYCREAFKKESGYRLPTVAEDSFWGNFNNPRFRAWIRFRLKSVGDFHQWLTETLKDKGFHLCRLACCSNCSATWSAQVATTTYEEFARGNNLTFQEVTSVTSTFYGWPRWAVEAKLFQAVGTRYGIPSLLMTYPHSQEEHFFGWALTKSLGQNYWGYLSDREEIKKYGEAFLWEERHRGLFHQPHPLANIAILFSRQTRDVYEGCDDNYYVNEWAGWCETLLGANIPYQVILDGDLTPKKLSQYKLLILPNAACLSPGQVETIRGFLQQGGNLILTYETSLYNEKGERLKEFALSDILGEYLGTFSSYAPSLIVEPEEVNHPLNAGRRGLIKADTPAVLIKPDEKVRVLATLSRQRITADYPVYPALTERAYGKGKVIYFAHKPGLMSYLPEMRTKDLHGVEKLKFLDHRLSEQGRLIRNAVRYLTADSQLLITKNVPEGVLITLYSQEREGRTCYVVHLLNATGSLLKHGDVVSEGYEVTFPDIGRGEEMELKIKAVNIKKVSLFSPDIEGEKEMEFEEAEGYVHLKIPADKLKRYSLLLLIPKDRPG